MKYISFYDSPKNAEENRYYATSCTNKLDYIATALCEEGVKVDILSPSCTQAPRGFFPTKQYEVREGVTVHLPPTRGFHSFFGKMIRRLWYRWAQGAFLYRRVKAGETVCAYHSVALSRVLCRLKKRKKIRLILQVEEIYADVSGKASDRKKEEAVFRAADAFIFCTESLNRKVNLQNKPYVITHGTYRNAVRLATHEEDGRTHCVYAGTFDTTKGGCETAIRSAEYLDGSFCLHIIGFGTREQTAHIEALVKEYSEKSTCEIRYDGLKTGQEFYEYIQRCHIGLSTQNPAADYNDSSFPSKVLTYLTNGLAVVSVKIPVLTESAVSDMLTYYEGNDARAVAEAIRACRERPNISYAQEIDLLHQEFKEKLIVLLEDKL